MAFTASIVFNSNTQADPRSGGNSTSAVLSLSVTAADVYPVGGEPLNVSTTSSIAALRLFREAYEVRLSTAINPAGVANDTTGAWIAAFERDASAAGRVRFYRSAGAGANLVELPSGVPYPNAARLVCGVLGRPLTDAI